MILPKGLSAQEIRVLQEFRRKEQEQLSADEIRGISHPVGGGVEPANALVSKGFLVAESDAQRFGLTDQAREFLAYDPKP